MIKAHRHTHTHRQPTWCVMKLATCAHQSLINQSNTETSLLHVICFSWNLIHWNRTFWGLFVPLHIEADVLFMVLLGTWRMCVCLCSTCVKWDVLTCINSVVSKREFVQECECSVFDVPQKWLLIRVLVRSATNKTQFMMHIPKLTVRQQWQSAARIIEILY